jgi:hypothetical protein
MLMPKAELAANIAKLYIFHEYNKKLSEEFRRFFGQIAAGPRQHSHSWFRVPWDT